MRTHRTPQTECSHNLPSCRRFGHIARRPPALLAFCASLLAVQFLLAGCAILSAQTSPAPAPAAASAHKHAPPRKKSSAAQPAAQPAPVPAPVPALPKAPDWPANDLPAEASVVWDSHGLLIVASNSSLAQILKEVATETGAKVEGMDQGANIDQRVFGTYGPGPARDVLSQLLDGSGYDVLMIGDQGQGMPRRIVLRLRSGGAAQHAANNTPSAPSEEDTEADQEAQEPQPEQPATPMQNGPAPAVPVRPEQRIMQEMQERRQQQQQQQQNPQN